MHGISVGAQCMVYLWGLSAWYMVKKKRNAMRKLLKRQLMKRKIKYDEIQENEKMTKIEKNWKE